MHPPYLGTDPDKLDNDPYWALDRAARRGDLDGLNVLIQQRRSGTNESKLTDDLTDDLDLPLQTAARKHDLPMVSYLLSEGAEITYAVVRSAVSPLSDKDSDAIPMLTLLQEHGWNINERPRRGEHIFFSILRSEKLTRYSLTAGLSLEKLTKRSARLTPITHAAYCSSPAVISLLLSHGALLTPRVLQNAIRGHDDNDDAAFEMYDYLLAQDPTLAAEVNYIDPLHHPSRTRIERLKLDFGAPLHWAVWSGRKTRIEFLMRKGADIGVRTLKKKQKASDWARILGKTGCLEVLEKFESGEEAG